MLNRGLGQISRTTDPSATQTLTHGTRGRIKMLSDNSETITKIKVRYKGIDVESLSFRTPEKSCVICSKVQCRNHYTSNDSCVNFSPATVEEWNSFKR